MKKTRSIVARNASELAKELGLSSLHGYRWELRHELVTKIIDAVEKAAITHAALARKAKTSRTRITSILNRNIDDVSTDLLLRILETLGYRVTVRISRRKAAA